jgi:hypothetical protein
MKVHFASGTHPFGSDWVNVDALNFPGVDLIVDLLSPFPDDLVGIDTAYVGHFLEHLTIEEGTDFLCRVQERMSVGGQLVIVGPDVDKAQRWFDAGKIPADLLAATKAHGSIPDDEPWNRAGVHLWDCTGAAVVSQCQEAGWTSAREIPLGRLETTLPGVPIIDATEWQFCVIASN